ncbi:histidine phosphotransferase family protein [Sinisalibacter aestuarii]|uniref:Histidine phosphotransferase n=1 Tax=Sinisalibacter aestuarii TaxID=2949426 RepID=A0ABQ5LU28_9RHOB|nr:histidine phosphotransferase family protein [Sinisalibacter aestuarii]GKY87925.1 histidine phosphotransferase [Sinisalibacter aestuarii]
MSARPPVPDLVALVGSRIAHDLASPIGAIANGVELLGLTGPADSPELALIAASVENASARIKAFRLAFGAAAPGQTVTEADMLALATAGERKLTLDWQPEGDVPRAEAKLALLALMCLETAMPWGGTARANRQGAHWRITATADRLKIDPPLWNALDGAALPEGLAAAQVHFAFSSPRRRRRRASFTSPAARWPSASASDLRAAPCHRPRRYT